MNQVKEQWKSVNQKIRKKVQHPKAYWNRKLSFHSSMFGLTSLYVRLPFFPRGYGNIRLICLSTRFGCQIWAAFKSCREIIEKWVLESSNQRCRFCLSMVRVEDFKYMSSHSYSLILMHGVQGPYLESLCCRKTSHFASVESSESLNL